MIREEVLTQCLSEFEDGVFSKDELLDRYAYCRNELEPVLRLCQQLEELPKDIVLQETTKARLRAQLLSVRPSAAPVPSLSDWWERLLAEGRRIVAPPVLGQMVRRPAGVVLPLALVFSLAGVVLSLALVFSLAGASTVSAAMGSIPGDGLYTVKTAVEQTRLALAVSDLDKAETYLWIASSRVEELSRMVEIGRLELASKVVTDYEQSLAQALLLASAQKQGEGEDRLQQQATLLQTSLLEIYEKAPESLQVMLAQTLALTSASPAAPDGGPSDPQASDETPGTQSSEPNQPAVDPGASPSRIINGLPDGGPLPDKGEITSVPGPTKDSPFSKPPIQSEPGDSLPPKGSIPPASEPVQGKDTTMPVLSAEDLEPAKDDSMPKTTEPAPSEGESATQADGETNPDEKSSEPQP